MYEIKFALTMLGSSDLERAVAFYSEVLGLRVSGRFGDFVLFDTGATTLVLTGELAPAESGPSSHECVFGVASVTQAYAALKDRIAFSNEPRPVNAQNWAVNFRDPDGHHCSLYGPE
jgi:catechol 2,3-dioxygenase-like lactoylglutathione lyase family enzyme